MTNAAEPTKAYQELQQLRLIAAKAFHEANNSHTLRNALMSKSRAEAMQFYPGDWVYYWRSGDQKLEPSRWRGPGIVCSMQPRDDTTTGPRPTIYWIAHGSALVRVAPEHLRAETPRECHGRLQHLPHTARTASVETTLRQILHPVRGPVRFLDFSGDPPFADATADKNDTDEPVNFCEAFHLSL